MTTGLRRATAPTILDRFEQLGPRHGRTLDPGVRIVPGDPRDYAALERFHYRAGRPATCVRTLCAESDIDGSLAGVLLVSMPTLNARWRPLLWGDRFRSGDKRRDAKAINDSLRTISRVVVDPRYRGLGVATLLVRAYLAQPLTQATEAVAAMGWVCPFFQCAGMRAVNLPPRENDAKLARDLREASVRAWELMDAARAEHLMKSSKAVARAVHAWARVDQRRGPRTRHPWHLAVLAAGSVGGRGVAYGNG